ncbi:hypothetical protein ACKWTF_007303 [Chironomus riparius]
MELKVWVEGIQRIVCGVTESTTCQDVVFALAHATGKTGRFTLIEKWRNNSRLLAPAESPLKILNKLGEYSGEVQFILQKSEKSVHQATENNVGENAEKKSPLDKTKKAINENVGIVKPQYQQQQSNENLDSTNKIESSSPEKLQLNTENSTDAFINQKFKVKNSPSPVTSPIGISGSLNPPPYRNPPSPAKQFQLPNSSKTIESNNGSNNIEVLNSPIQSNDDLLHTIQYKDLIQLIKLQRDKIINQQNDLTKFDAEIVYLESKSREQLQQFELISNELTKTDQAYRQGNDQLQTLQYVEEENELVHQQEKSLKAEITLLRSKLGILETELLQCKNKIKKLMNDLQLEQKSLSQQQENHHILEQKLMTEVDRIQSDIDFVMHSNESTQKTTDSLKKDVLMLEMSIVEKKKQLEKLVHEMKEVNLQSLTVTTEDHHLFYDGSGKRRMIGSPRQLVNAPAHGVWV